MITISSVQRWGRRQQILFVSTNLGLKKITNVCKYYMYREECLSCCRRNLLHISLFVQSVIYFLTYFFLESCIMMWRKNPCRCYCPFMIFQYTFVCKRCSFIVHINGSSFVTRQHKLVSNSYTQVRNTNILVFVFNIALKGLHTKTITRLIVFFCFFLFFLLFCKCYLYVAFPTLRFLFGPYVHVFGMG